METPTDYWQLIEESWSGQRDLILLEEDVVPPDGLLAEMAACPEDWCAGTFGKPWRVPVPRNPDPVTGAYDENDWILHSDIALGLNRFSAGFQAAHPDALIRAAEPYVDKRRNPVQKHWCHLDPGLIQWTLLYQLRLEPHIHWPACGHVRPG